MSSSSQKSTRIFLIGPMGVGKTTIGRILAKDLRLDFVDCDVEIEERSGASIAWIFDVEGEEGFRERETQLLDELTARQNILIATGGGAVIKKKNREYLRDRGIVVFLDSSLDLLVKRTSRDKKRPLLQNANPKEVLDKIKSERDHLYREIAHLRIFIDDNSSRNSANQILQQLKSEGVLD